MDTDESILIGILILLIMASAFFSMSETALTSLSKIRVKQMSEHGVKGAKYVEKVVKNPKKMLNTILIGNNTVNTLASALATSIAISLAGNDSFAIAISTVIVTIVILIFGEVTPKTFAVQNEEKVSLKVARIINFLTWLFTPLVFVLNKITGVIIKILGGDTDSQSQNITTSDLKAIISIGHEQGVIEVEEKTILDNLFEFRGNSAKDIMTPRTDMSAIASNATYWEIKKTFEEDRFSRLPVYTESIDNIIGILYLKDFAFINVESFDLEKMMRQPYYTYETKSTSELFKIMRMKRITMAVVLDEYGGTLGILTVEDLIEEIVGDISDEDDKEAPEIQRISDNEYIIEGSTKIDDVNDTLKTNFELDDVESIGGLVIGISGRIPLKGDVVEIDGVKFLIDEVDKNRILTMKVTMNI